MEYPEVRYSWTDKKYPIRRKTVLVYLQNCGDMQKMDSKKEGTISIPNNPGLTFVEANRLYEAQLGRKSKGETMSQQPQKTIPIRDTQQKISFAKANKYFEEELMGRRPR